MRGPNWRGVLLVAIVAVLLTYGIRFVQRGSRTRAIVAFTSAGIVAFVLFTMYFRDSLRHSWDRGLFMYHDPSAVNTSAVSALVASSSVV